MNLPLVLAMMVLPAASGLAQDEALRPQVAPTTEQETEQPDPQLVRLDSALTKVQEDKRQGRIDEKRYREFLVKFRADLEAAMLLVKPALPNTALHARILVLLGDHKEAVANLQGALKKNPDDPTLHLSLGRARLENKDYAGAFAEANAVLEKDPNNGAAKFLKVESQGRSAPSGGAAGMSGTKGAQTTPTTAMSNRPAVAYASTPKLDPIVSEVPAVPADQPAPKNGTPLPLWPLAIPLSGAMIGYGIYKGQQTTTWGENAELDKSAEATDEQIARNRRTLKAVGLAGGVLVGGYAVAALGPYAAAGAEAFFTSMGPPTAGFALVGGGATGGAAALNPAVVTAGAQALGATTVLVGETKVASDYITTANSDPQKSGASEHPNGIYEGSSKHGGGQRYGPKGTVSPEPQNGQAALDNSVQAKPTSSARIGIDVENEEFVVLREHLPDRFHGYVNKWEGLEEFARNALIRAGKATARGRIIKR